VAVYGDLMSEEQLTSEEKSFLKYIGESGHIRLEPNVSPDGIIYKNLETDEYDSKQILFYRMCLALVPFLG
jgi:hypothetical protein